MNDSASPQAVNDPGPAGPVDQQAAALEADPPPAGSGAPGGPAEEAGIVDQQDAARAAMEQDEGTTDIDG